MSESAWVVDASPLILYARIGRLDLLEYLAPCIMVPAKVLEEVRQGLWKDEAAKVAISWAETRVISDAEIPVSIEHWDVGPGESQVITHCLGKRRWAVLDDRMARRCAEAHNVLTVGSIGIVLRAKESGGIPNAKPWLNKLKAAGMYISEDIIARCLIAVGEEP